MLKDTMTRFDEKFSNSDFWLNPKNYPKNYKLVKKYISKEIKKIKETTEANCENQYREFIAEKNKEIQEEIKLALEDYTDFLCKYGYTDSDVYAEEPKAVDRFLSGEK